MYVPTSSTPCRRFSINVLNGLLLRHSAVPSNQSVEGVVASEHSSKTLKTADISLNV